MKTAASTFFCLLLAVPLLAQITEADERYQKMEDRYKTIKDSLARTRAFVPAVSSVVVDKKQLEIVVFHSLLTATRYRGAQQKIVDLNIRQTYFYHTLQLTYGVSGTARINLGMDINTTFARFDADPESSPLKVFSPGNGESFTYAEKALTSLGPRVRWRPFKKNYRFTIQSSFLFSVAAQEKRQFLGQNQSFWTTQFLYNQSFGKRFFVFSQATVQYGLKGGTNTYPLLYTPLTLFVSYLLPPKVLLFGFINHTPVFAKVSSWKGTSNSSQAGIGTQYQFSNRFLVNAFFAGYFAGKNTPAFFSYNLGVRALFLRAARRNGRVD